MLYIVLCILESVIETFFKLTPPPPPPHNLNSQWKLKSTVFEFIQILKTLSVYSNMKENSGLMFNLIEFTIWLIVIKFCIEIGPESTHFYKSADAHADPPKKWTMNETNLTC